jgi:hypothetical protein
MSLWSRRQRDGWADSSFWPSSTPCRRRTRRHFLALHARPVEATGYRGRWPSYAPDTLDATNAAAEQCATAFQYGRTVTLDHLVSFIG